MVINPQTRNYKHVHGNKSLTRADIEPTTSGSHRLRVPVPTDR